MTPGRMRAASLARLAMSRVGLIPRETEGYVEIFASLREMFEQVEIGEREACAELAREVAIECGYDNPFKIEKRIRSRGAM